MKRILIGVCLFFFPLNAYFLFREGYLTRASLLLGLTLFVVALMPFLPDMLLFGYLTVCAYFFVGFNPFIANYEEKIVNLYRVKIQYYFCISLPVIIHLFIFIYKEFYEKSELFPLFSFNFDGGVNLVERNVFIGCIVIYFLVSIYFLKVTKARNL